MSSTKQLLEKANRKCEMRWRVFAFDPAKDNELVHTSKDAFDCIKMAGEYKMDLAKKHPDYIIEIIAESKEYKNEADKVFLKKIEDVLHRYNLPSAKIVDERKVDNTHYVYKIDVNSTDYAKALQRDAVDFDKLKKDNALKALSFLEIDGIYPQRNSQSILMQINFRKGKPESSQKNEAVNAAKVKQDVEKAVKDYFKNDKDALEYVYVDSKKDSLGRTVIEVRAELGYNGMTKLADHLDRVVQKHDRYAYFEQESGGIMTAVFESAQKNEDYKKPVYANDFKVDELYILPDGEDVLRVSRIDKDNVYYSYVTGKHANNHTYYISHPEINYKGTKWVDKSKFFSNRIKEIQDKIKYHTTEIDKLKKELNSLK